MHLHWMNLTSSADVRRPGGTAMDQTMMGESAREVIKNKLYILKKIMYNYRGDIYDY